MTLEEAKNAVGLGWSPLIEHYFRILRVVLAEWSIEVTEVSNRLGMLSIRAKCSAPLVQDILDSLTWTTERASAKMCEICGEKGFRRKMISGSPNRCTKHYIELANEIGVPSDQ